MGTLIFLAIIIFIFLTIHPVATFTFLTIILVVTVLVCRAIRKSDDKIVSAEVIDRTQVMTETCERSGFSIGWHGNPRMHWRFKQVPAYVKVNVAVVYDNGKHRVLTLTEGSSRYNRIASICEKRKAVPAKTVLPSDELPKTNTTEVDYVDVRIYAYFCDAILFHDGVLWREG